MNVREWGPIDEWGDDVTPWAPRFLFFISTPLTILGIKLGAWLRSDLGMTLRATRPSGAETYVLSDGMTLIQDGETATFNTADFVNILLATAAEVVAVINTDWTLNGATDTTGDFTVSGSGVLTGTALVALGLSARPFITAWADQGDEGNNLTQAALGDQLTFFASGGPNDAPFVQGNLAGGWMSVSGGFALVQPHERFLILLPSVTGTFAGTLCYIDGAAFIGSAGRTVAASSTDIHAGTSLVHPGTNIDVFQRQEALYNGASSSISHDGDTPTVGNANINNPNGLTIGEFGGGAGAPCDMSIVEIIQGNAAFTAAEAEALRFYSLARHAL